VSFRRKITFRMLRACFVIPRVYGEATKSTGYLVTVKSFRIRDEKPAAFLEKKKSA